jgi:hypothetical protein
MNKAVKSHLGRGAKKKDTMEAVAWRRFVVMTLWFLLTVFSLLWGRAYGKSAISFDLVLCLSAAVLLWGGSGITIHTARKLGAQKLDDVIDDERDKTIAGKARQWTLLGVYVLLALSILLFEWHVVRDRLPMASISAWIGQYLFLLLLLSLWIEALVCVLLYRCDRTLDA